MADCSQYSDSTRKRNLRLTPGSQPWAAAVIHDLRAGYGIEDIALRLDCRAEAVREKVAELRRFGLLSQLYAQARRGWRA